MATETVGKTNEADIDNTILDIWELVNKILQHQTLLESWMKGGYMNIAKARYVMGQQSVSANQLPSGEREISARVRVDRIADDELPVPSAAAFRLREHSDASEPLRWFSGLPPGALRDAQTQFRRSLEITCEIATMKGQLAALVAGLDGRRRELAGLTDAVEALAVS